MAQLRKVLLLHFGLFLLSSLLICAYSKSHHQQQQQGSNFSARKLFGKENVVVDDEEEIIVTKPKKKTPSTSLENSLPSKKNQTKINTTDLSTKNQTKLIKTTNLSTKNQTKLIKTTNLSTNNQTKINTKKTNSTKTTSTTLNDSISTPTTTTPKIELKKLNSTSKIKKLNSTKLTIDLTKPTSPKNKTTPPTKKPNPVPLNDTNTKNDNKKPKKQTTSKPSWFDQDDDNTDLVSEFTDLPSKFQQTLIPDLERISTTSKLYLTKANKDLTKNFKPIVGPKYAPTVASLVSFAFMLIPLMLVSLLFNKIKAYFSLQKLLIFVQVYLSIYFAILCLSSLVTGLEPLRFFYATSRSTYVCVQVLQTLAYVLYLLMLLMYLILVFSTECGLGSKLLGLGQTLVGFAVGLHYYVAVFHRVVLRQPPKTNWKVHGIYATCFFLICLCARADRTKKAYLEDGGQEGKKN